MTATPLAQLRVELDLLTLQRAAKDEEVDDLANELGAAQLEVQRLEAVLREVAFERDELTKAEDAKYEAFLAAGGRLQPIYSETRYWEPA